MPKYADTMATTGAEIAPITATAPLTLWLSTASAALSRPTRTSRPAAIAYSPYSRSLPAGSAAASAGEPSVGAAATPVGRTAAASALRNGRFIVPIPNAPPVGAVLVFLLPGRSAHGPQLIHALWPCISCRHVSGRFMPPLSRRGDGTELS